MSHLHIVDDLVVPDEPEGDIYHFAMLERILKNQIAIMRYLDNIAGGNSGLAAIVAVSNNVLLEVNS